MSLIQPRAAWTASPGSTAPAARSTSSASSPSLPGYVYAQRGDSLYVNLYAPGTGKMLLGSQTVQLTQHTRYPWDGVIRMEVCPSAATAFTLRLRLPGWAEGRPVPSDLYRYLPADSASPTLSVNSHPIDFKREQGFAVVAADLDRRRSRRAEPADAHSTGRRPREGRGRRRPGGP